jgi:hypothetical protein
MYFWKGSFLVKRTSVMAHTGMVILVLDSPLKLSAQFYSFSTPILPIAGV